MDYRVAAYVKHFGNKKVYGVIDGEIKYISRAEALERRQVASLLEFDVFLNRPIIWDKKQYKIFG